MRYIAKNRADSAHDCFNNKFIDYKHMNQRIHRKCLFCSSNRRRPSIKDQKALTRLLGVAVWNKIHQLYDNNVQAVLKVYSKITTYILYKRSQLGKSSGRRDMCNRVIRSSQMYRSAIKTTVRVK